MPFYKKSKFENGRKYVGAFEKFADVVTSEVWSSPKFQRLCAIKNKSKIKVTPTQEAKSFTHYMKKKSEWGVNLFTN